MKFDPRSIVHNGWNFWGLHPQLDIMIGWKVQIATHKKIGNSARDVFWGVFVIIARVELFWGQLEELSSNNT